MKRKFLTLLFLLMTTFGTLVVTGCGSSLTTYFTSDFPLALTERGQQNKDIARRLLDAGFIDLTMYNNLCAQIDSEVNKIKNDCIITASDESALSNAAVKTLSAAVSNVNCREPEFVEYEDNDGNSALINTGSFSEASNRIFSKVDKNIKIKEASLSYFVASNYVVGQYLGSDGAGYAIDNWAEKTNVEPINFFGGQDDLVDTLNKRFRADMYVLDADAIVSSGKSIDEVFAAIKTAVDKDDISGVTHFFKKLKDSSGNAVTLMDETFNLIVTSENNTDSSISKPGHDLIMKQTLYYHSNSSCGQDNTGTGNACSNTSHAIAEEKPVLSVRFTEFSQDKFDELERTININSGAYYFDKLNSTQSSGGMTTRCYVLTYPISVIDEFNLDERTGNVTATFNDNSGMAVSIQTGKLISYDYADDGVSFSTTCHEITTSDPYLNMNFDANVGDEKSSLVCDGYRTYTINTITYDAAGNKKITPKNIVVPRIILRDYLEATWAPGSVSYDETVVAFGRKIRFRTDSTFWTSANSFTFNNKTYNNNTLQYNINNIDWCASFIDIDGNEVGSLTKLYITDFCDIDYLAKGLGTFSNKWKRYKVKHFKEAGMQATSQDCLAEATELSPLQDKLASTTDTTNLKVSMGFPSKYIGNTDINNTGAEVQRFYCVATTKGMFDSALYSDWINSTASRESLTWWNGYLADHGYHYTIGTNDISTYLQANYQYELSQHGAIILDLDTISKIHEIYENEDADNRISIIRTIFVVIGIFLIAYTMILMLCWIIDTNTDLGFSLTNKATLGHWVAIKYEEDLPSYNADEQCYVDGKHMLIKCIIIIAIAIILIRVDVIEIILVLISTFGKIASYVENMIKGLN